MVGFTAFILTIVLGVLGIALGILLLRGGRRSGEPRIDDGRLERLEGALSSLESRVEDLQDQQRFLERLLADRPGEKLLGPGGGDAPRESEGEGAASILFDTGETEEPRDG